VVQRSARRIVTNGQPFAAKGLKEDLQPSVLKHPDLSGCATVDYLDWQLSLTAHFLPVVSDNLLVTFSDGDHFT
jgi:hypothetical protein